MCRVYWLWVFLCVGLSHRVIVFVISFPVISSVVLISDCCVVCVYVGNIIEVMEFSG